MLLEQEEAWRIADAKGKVDTSKGALDVSAIRVRVDPRAEWRQIFHEAWRVNRDYFYDPSMLGADFEVADGRYRIAKVYGGLNWDPELRSPPTEPGVEVKAGEYLLAVSGRDLRPPENLYARFENTAGRRVEIVLEALAANPPVKRERPPFPIRVRR